MYAFGYICQATEHHESMWWRRYAKAHLSKKKKKRRAIRRTVYFSGVTLLLLKVFYSPDTVGSPENYLKPFLSVIQSWKSSPTLHKALTKNLLANREPEGINVHLAIKFRWWFLEVTHWESKDKQSVAISDAVAFLKKKKNMKRKKYPPGILNTPFLCRSIITTGGVISTVYTWEFIFVGWQGFKMKVVMKNQIRIWILLIVCSLQSLHQLAIAVWL